MDKLLAIQKIPKLTQKEIENRNRSIMSKEIILVIQNFPTKKNPGPDGFIDEFCKTFKEKLIPIFLKLFQKNLKERNTSKIIL